MSVCGDLSGFLGKKLLLLAYDRARPGRQLMAAGVILKAGAWMDSVIQPVLLQPSRTVEAAALGRQPWRLF